MCVCVGGVFLVTLLLLAQHGTKLSVCILCLHPDTQYLKSTTIQIPHSGSFENWSVLHTCVDVTAVGSANPKSTQLSLFAPMHTRMEVMEGRNLRRALPWSLGSCQNRKELFPVRKFLKMSQIVFPYNRGKAKVPDVPGIRTHLSFLVLSPPTCGPGFALPLYQWTGASSIKKTWIKKDLLRITKSPIVHPL